MPYVLYRNSNVAWQGNRPNSALRKKLDGSVPDNLFRIATPEDLDALQLYKLIEAPKTAGKITTVTNHQKQGFEVHEVYTQVDDPDYVAPDPLADAKAAKAQEIAQARYDEEVGGLDVSGVIVATDRESQTKLVAARIVAKEDPTYTLDWKAESGFVVLDAVTIISLADAVLAFIKGLFTKEKDKNSQIVAATTVDAVNAIQWDDV